VDADVPRRCGLSLAIPQWVDATILPRRSKGKFARAGSREPSQANLRGLHQANTLGAVNIPHGDRAPTKIGDHSLRQLLANAAIASSRVGS